jgi:peroxiredoxin Q/BCP
MVAEIFKGKLSFANCSPCEYGRIMPARATVLILAMLSIFPIHAQALEVGSPAPLISAPDQDGQDVRFADVYAKGPTLVYFYPKADTPGCTAQACSLRDSFATLHGENLQILGVSRDTPEKQKAFQEKYKIPFPLIADKSGDVAKAFGVPNILGLPVSSRQSFLIQDGKIVWISLKAKTDTHAAEVQAAIDALK